MHRAVDESVLGKRHMDGGGRTREVYWTEGFDGFGVVNAWMLVGVVSLVGLTMGGRVCKVLLPASSSSSASGKNCPPSLPRPRVHWRLVALWGGASLAFLLLALLLHLVFAIPPVAALLTPSFLGYALSSGFALLLSLYLLMTLPPFPPALASLLQSLPWLGPV